MDADCNARLADFGLASFIDGAAPSGTGAYVGKALWTAPELLFPEKFGRPPDDCRPTAASDIYAFGMLCYEVGVLAQYLPSWR